MASECELEGGVAEARLREKIDLPMSRLAPPVDARELRR